MSHSLRYDVAGMSTNTRKGYNLPIVMQLESTYGGINGAAALKFGNE